MSKINKPRKLIEILNIVKLEKTKIYGAFSIFLISKYIQEKKEKKEEKELDLQLVRVWFRMMARATSWSTGKFWCIYVHDSVSM